MSALPLIKIRLHGEDTVVSPLHNPNINYRKGWFFTTHAIAKKSLRNFRNAFDDKCAEW